MISTQYLAKCIENLEKFYNLYNKKDQEQDLYDAYRSAIIKEFELVLEQSGKLLKKI